MHAQDKVRGMILSLRAISTSTAHRAALCPVEPILRLTKPLFKRPLERDVLRNVWGFRSLGRTRTLDSHASRLRRKLNRSADTAYVLNVWGVGYRLVAAA
jgi:Transcriptional regulatory protein, C terminal